MKNLDSFIKGISRLFNPFGSPEDVERIKHNIRDKKYGSTIAQGRLRSCWEAVGNDMRKAIDKYEKEIER